MVDPSAEYKLREEAFFPGERIKINVTGLVNKDRPTIVDARVVCVAPDQWGVRIELGYAGQSYEYWV